MDPRIRAALDRGGIIDITTTGRRSGEPRRIEIVFHNIRGRIVISGMPARERVRAWLRNLEADFAAHASPEAGRRGGPAGNRPDRDRRDRAPRPPRPRRAQLEPRRRRRDGRVEPADRSDDPRILRGLLTRAAAARRGDARGACAPKSQSPSRSPRGTPRAATIRPNVPAWRRRGRARWRQTSSRSWALPAVLGRHSSPPAWPPRRSPGSGLIMTRPGSNT